MSSGEERTQNWLLANMSPRTTENGPEVIPADFLDDTMDVNSREVNPVELSPVHSLDLEGAMLMPATLSPVNSLDLDRMSPLECNDDDGPPSIGSDGSKSEENREVSGITSNWISSGGQYAYNTVQEPYRPSVDPSKEPDQHDQVFNFDNVEPIIGCSQYPDKDFVGPLRRKVLFVPLSNGGSEDVLDEQANSGVCGLTNIGNTCFMASGIQCLVNTPPITQYFFSHNQDSDEYRETIAGALSQLVFKIWSGKYTSIQPTTFKEYFGKHFHEFRDFRQHDCQEFLLLLFETLRKQMPISKSEALESYYYGTASLSSEMSSSSDQHTGSRNSSSPTPPNSPVSASSYKQYSRSDTQEDIIGIDSGPASPRSSISSSSTDPHVASLRMRPIPEEVRQFYSTKMDICQDDISVTGTLSGHDLESVTSDMSEDCPDPSDPTANVRQYNRFSTTTCDTFDCDTDPKTICDTPPNLLEKNQKANLHQSKLLHINDIISKEIRTSNVNVLVKDHTANNKLFFDSEKYGKDQIKRLKSVDNLNKGSYKRVKEVNLLVEKMDSSNIDPSLGKQNNDGIPNKKVKYDDSYQINLDKSNTRMEEQIQDLSQHKSEQEAADENWRHFFTEGDNVVVNSFYGQYKSSIVCCACGHTSDKFEPFGTLTLPLPNASIIQLGVVFVPSRDASPISYLISISKMSHVSDIIDKICEYTHTDPSSICVAEVFDNHISRLLDPTTMTKVLNYRSRSIYAFELPPDDEDPCSSEMADGEDMPIEKTELSVSARELEKPCNICLEDKFLSELSTHTNCEDCWLCCQCVKMSLKHHGGQRFPCPVCQTKLDPDVDLIHVDENSKHVAKSRIVKVPVVFRLDSDSEDNNKRATQLVGHPSLLVLPKRLSADSLLKILRRRVTLVDDFQLVFVDGKGSHCSRCLYSAHCHGCEAIENSEVILKSGDTLCVRFANLSESQRIHLEKTKEDESVSAERLNTNLTLHDCLRAYTKKELMEGCEAWLCPKCEKKQKATKTISIWRNPPFLIIHLERFLFQGNSCSKLDDRISFPTEGLDMTEFVSRDTGIPVTYNLYGCICHSGSSAECGHYTALTRSPLTGEWHSFNDSTVTSRKPSEEEFSLAYILFFYRKGVKFDLTLPVTFPILPSPQKPISDVELGKHLPNYWDENEPNTEVAGCSMGPLPYPLQPPSSPETLGCEPRPTCSPIEFGNIVTPPLSEDEPNVMEQINAQIKKMDEDTECQ